MLMMSFDDALTRANQLCVFSTILSSEFFLTFFNGEGLNPPNPPSGYTTGVNTLANTVSRLCKKAGFVGFFSNHSLRATAATRLFNANVEEQLVKLKTGHTSDAVRSYKRVSDVKLRAMSDIVACKSAKLSTFGKNEAQESTATVADLSTCQLVDSFVIGCAVALHVLRKYKYIFG